MPPEHFTAKPGAEDRLLASIDLIDAAQACAVLRIETDDPEGAMLAMVRGDAIITLAQNGEIRLPLFQFDTELDRVFDVVGAILELRPARISNLRLCYWLGSRLIDLHNQNMTVAARATTERKTFGLLS